MTAQFEDQDWKCMATWARVRTRTHGGVEGVSGQLLPLCRSDGLTFHDPVKELESVRRLVVGRLFMRAWILFEGLKLIAPRRDKLSYRPLCHHNFFPRE